MGINEELSVRFSKSELRDQYFDVVVIGSGYGGSVVASRLARAKNGNDKPLKICILEQGPEIPLGEYPKQLGDFPDRVLINAPEIQRGLPERALFNINSDRGVTVITGRGLGGTSQINANVALKPDFRIFNSEAWPSPLRNATASLGSYFLLAEQMLRPAQLPRNDTPRKLQALEETSKRIKKQYRSARFERAPITVNFDETVPHPVTGALQPACNSCGNCVSGCNSGAKNTLRVNYLRDAHNLGVKIVNLCTVRYLSRLSNYKTGANWELNVSDTAFPETQATIKAGIVVLAGGVLGSTEVLLRSRAKSQESDPVPLAFSQRLGQRFSTNGDMIGFGYSPNRKEKLTQRPDQSHDEYQPGPCITGFIDLRDDVKVEKGIVIQEGTSSRGLLTILNESVTTSFYLHNLTKKTELPSKGDPLAATDEVGTRTQVYLAMGHDQARGKLELVDDRLRVNWPDVGNQDVFRAQEAILKMATQGTSEQYLSNPAWRPLDENVSTLLGNDNSDDNPGGGQVLTVHPLGGCPMGDDAITGVVNHKGQVFKRSEGNDCYHDLYVCDGSVIPTSIGVNPLLTITALSERCVALMAEDRGWNIDYQMPSGRDQNSRPDSKPGPCNLYEAPNVSKLIINEQLRGRLKLIEAPKKYISVNLTLCLTAENVNKFLYCKDHPTKIGVIPDHKNPFIENLSLTFDKGSATILAPRKNSCLNRTMQVVYVFVTRFKAQWKLWTLHSSQFAFLQHHNSHRWESFRNSFKSCLRNIYRFRESPPSIKEISSYLIRSGEQLVKWVRLWISRISQYAKFARIIFRAFTDRRVIKYTLNFKEDNETYYELKGAKEITNGWGHSLVDDLKTLRKVTLTRIDSDGTRTLCATGELVTNMDHFLQPNQVGLWEIKQFFLNVERDATPRSDLRSLSGVDRIEALGQLMSALLFLGRVIGKTYFMNFGLPRYPKPATPQPAGSHGILNAEYVWIQTYKNDAEAKKLSGKKKPGTIRLLLTNFIPTKGSQASKGPILLLHGFGGSSRMLAIDSVDKTIVEAFAEDGFDVWLLDYRTSPVLPTADDPCDMYDIATYDIPTALKEICLKTGHQKIAVFGQCIGAATLMISLLRGTATPYVKAAIFSQAGFYLLGSSLNRFKRPIPFMLKRVLNIQNATAYADINSSWREKILDFFLKSYPLEPEEACNNPTCQRMTALYGRQYDHDNVTRLNRHHKSVHDGVHEAFGAANMTLFEHISRCFEARRLVTSKGEDAWVRRDLIRKNLLDIPMLFVHGENNQVFTPESTLFTVKALRGYGHMQVSHLLCKGFGHLDCVVSGEAGKTIFPRLVDFLNKPKTLRCNATIPHPRDSQNGANRTPLPIRHTTQANWDRLRNRKMSAPLIGPIVGHTTSTSTNIWIRANEASAESVYGCALVYALDAPEPFHIKTNIGLTQHRAGDVYGVFNLTNLQPDTRYKVLVGTSSSQLSAEEVLTLLYVQTIRDPSQDNGELHQSFAWARLKTMPDPQKSQKLAFIIGSCHHPNDIFGSIEDNEIFTSMEKLLWPDKPCADAKFQIFMGDQIYADPYNVATPAAQTDADYSSRYVEAFSPTTPKGRIMANLPTYMILDDHEIENEWTPLRLKTESAVERKEARTRYFAARRAYECYQRSHSPLRNHINKWRNWYEFESAGYPFFVLDTRTERRIRDEGDDGKVMQNDMIGEKQFAELESWLRRQCPTKPKFIVSPGVFAPDLDANKVAQDTWARFPKTRKKVLDLIWNDGKPLKNVVFLSGDYHCSLVAKIEGCNGMVAHSIVASPFHSSIKFVNTNYEKLKKDHAISDRYKCTIQTLQTADFPEARVVIDESNNLDNFGYVEVEPANNGGWSIFVSFYGRSEKLLRQKFKLT